MRVRNMAAEADIAASRRHATAASERIVFYCCLQWALWGALDTFYRRKLEFSGENSSFGVDILVPNHCFSLFPCLTFGVHSKSAFTRRKISSVSS